MAYSNSCTSEDFDDGSLGFSARALLSEFREKTCVYAKNNSSEVECEPHESGVAPMKCAKNDKTGSESDFSLSSKSSGCGVSSIGSSAGSRSSKKRRKYRNRREVLDCLRFSDSDDDFKEPKYSFPVAPRARKTCEDGVISKSCQTVPSASQSVETSGKVPPESEFFFEQLDAELPSASRTKESAVPSVGTSASSDDFGVHELVDSFFDDLSSPKQHQNKLDCDETNSHNAYGTKKVTKIKHKPPKVCPSSTLSPRLARFAAKNVKRGGNINNEVQSDATAALFPGLFDDSEDISGTGNKAECIADSDTLCTGDRVESGAEGGTKPLRFRQKRVVNDFFDETFDLLDVQNKEMSQAANPQSSSTAVSTDGTCTGLLKRPSSVADSKPRTGQFASNGRPNRVTAMQMKSLSGDSSCIPGMGIDVVNMTGSRFQNLECQDVQDQPAANGGKLSAAVGSVPGAGSESAMTSNPVCRKRLGLSCRSSLAGNSRSLASHVADVHRNNTGSASSTGWIFSRSEDAEKNESHGGRSRPHLDSAVVENSLDDRTAVNDRRQVRDISRVKHRMVRKRSHSHTTADAGAQSAAAASNNDQSDKFQLKRRPLRARAIPCDDDEDADEGLACDHSDGNSGHRAVESSASANDSVVIIGSDDDVATPTEYTSLQTPDLSDGQQRNNVESSVTAEEAGSSGRHWGRRQKRTARMSCGALNGQCLEGFISLSRFCRNTCIF